MNTNINFTAKDASRILDTYLRFAGKDLTTAMICRLVQNGNKFEDIMSLFPSSEIRTFYKATRYYTDGNNRLVQKNAYAAKTAKDAMQIIDKAVPNCLDILERYEIKCPTWMDVNELVENIRMHNLHLNPVEYITIHDER